MKKKIIRTATIAGSLDILLKGQLRFLNSHFEVVAVSGEDDHLRNLETREEVRVIPVGMNRSISPIKDLVSLLKLYLLFLREKPDVVHSITPKAGLLSMVAAYLARVPIRMHTFTGLIFPSKTGLMKRLLIGMDRILCRCATDIYPEGQGVKNDLLHYRITNKDLKVIGNGNVNGVNVNEFTPSRVSIKECEFLRQTLGLTGSEFIYIFVGRLVKDKGINELVHAFESVANKVAHVALLLVGATEHDLDPLDREVLDTIENHTRIIHVGFQKDVVPYFAISHALIFPSHREGFPNVVLQACAMNLPAIVTDINGCNEIVQDNVNGFVIPVNDESKIGDSMLRMLEHDTFNKLKEQSRSIILEKFNQEYVWSCLLREYTALLKIKDISKHV